jgi:hypothetical protein
MLTFFTRLGVVIAARQAAGVHEPPEREKHQDAQDRLKSSRTYRRRVADWPGKTGQPLDSLPTVHIDGRVERIRPTRKCTVGGGVSRIWLRRWRRPVSPIWRWRTCLTVAH